MQVEVCILGADQGPVGWKLPLEAAKAKMQPALALGCRQQNLKWSSYEIQLMTNTKTNDKDKEKYNDKDNRLSPAWNHLLKPRRPKCSLPWPLDVDNRI